MQTVGQQSIDATRAALCALSWASARQAEPVHTLRLSHLARAIYPDADSLNDLGVMEDFGEACKLPNGYWLPVRSSLVPLDQAFLLIAPNPMSELCRRVGKCDYTMGLARFCEIDSAPAWPRQSIDHWTRRPAGLRQWTDRQITSHWARLTPTRADSHHLEFYSGLPWKVGQRRRWISVIERRSVDSPDELLLLRERAGGKTVRHFVGTCRGASLVREATLECDLIRLQFGIEMAAGAVIRLQGRRIGSCLRLRITRPFPREERKLISAVCDVAQDEKCTEIGVPGYAEQACCRLLGELGIQVEASDG